MIEHGRQCLIGNEIHSQGIVTVRVSNRILSGWEHMTGSICPSLRTGDDIYKIQSAVDIKQ